MNTRSSNLGALLSLITIGSTFMIALALCL